MADSPPNDITPPATTRPSRRDLDRGLAHGIAWTGGVKYLTQIVRWGSTLVILRLLTRGDYGLMSMAMVYLGLVQLVNEFGLSSAIVQQRDLAEDQLAGLGGLSFAIGTVLFLLSLLLAPALGAFYGEPRLVAIVRVLAFNFVFRAAQVVPRGLLNRDLKFRTLAAVDGAEAVSQAIIALILAWLGYGYWALVFGSLGAAAIATVLIILARPHPIRWPRAIERVRGALKLGWHIALSRFAWYVYSNADFAVVGRLLGKDMLGAYSFGWTLANMPVERVAAMVGRVTPAVFASVGDDPPALRRYLLRITEALAVATFPAAIGMALVANDFVLVVMGDKWFDAIAPLRLLCVYGAIRSVTTLLPDVLVAIGQARRNAQASIAMAIVLPILFIIGAKTGGTVGVAWAWLIGYPALLIPYFGLVALRAIGSNLLQYAEALWPAASACGVMAAAIITTQRFTTTLPRATRLGLLVAVGGVAFILTMLLLHRERIRAFREVFSQVRRRKPIAPTEIEPPEAKG